MNFRITLSLIFAFFFLTVSLKGASAGYLSQAQVSEIFKVVGTLSIHETAQYPFSSEPVSNLLIEPQDNSFDEIQIQLAHKGVLLSQYSQVAAAWQPDPSVKEDNPIAPIKFPNGDDGYFITQDGGGGIVLSSKTGGFDIYIEVIISQYTRDPIQVTNSNRELVAGLVNNDDHGLKFLTEVMRHIYPIAEKEYQTRINKQPAWSILASSPASKAIQTASTDNSPRSSPWSDRDQVKIEKAPLIRRYWVELLIGICAAIAAICFLGKNKR